MAVDLPRSTPEAQGIPSRAILDLVEAFESQLDAVHSIMVVRHGHVVAEGWWRPYGPQHPHSLFSVSKSFTSTAVGFAVAEGLLTVDDLVIDLLPDDLPAHVSDNLARLRVRHLLTMSTGHTTPASLDRAHTDNWAAAMLADEIGFEPGTRFRYDSGATYLVSAILQRLTGMPLTNYLTPRLFEPLGIENARWETCPRGINTGGWGLHLRTEDVAKLGQLDLQRGSWQGEQLLPESWIAEATSVQIATPDEPNPDWAQGYGYQFWVSRHGYRADGAFGQFCLVLPDHDTVVTLTSGVSETQPELDLLWKHLLPALSPETLPESAEDHDALAAKLGSLGVKAPEPVVPVHLAPRRFALAANDSPFTALTLETGRDEDVITLWREGLPHEIRSGRSDWEYGEWSALEWTEPIAARGGWANEHTLRARIVAYLGAYVFDLEAKIDGDTVVLRLDQNLALGEEPLRLRVTGQAESAR